MPNHIKISLGFLLALALSCNNIPAVNPGSIVNCKWELIGNQGNNLNLNPGDTIQFSRKGGKCIIGSEQNLSYYTNDSLLLLNYYNTRHVFKINFSDRRLELVELYSGNNTTYTFKAISD